MYANVTRHMVSRFPYEVAKVAHDIAGGIVGTAPASSILRRRLSI